MTYSAGFAAKNAKHRCKMQKITTEQSNIINYNNSNNNHTLTTAYTSIKLVADRQADIVTYRAANAAKKFKI